MIYAKYVKRILDMILSLSAIIVLSPLLLILYLLVRVKLGSPVLFRQERPGRNGEIFTLCKFRTMTDKRNEKGELLPDEERLTGFGKMLRSTSLDELPELFNILKGDMSLVGPRPERPEIAREYQKQVPEFEFRLKVKAGLTGYAQVYGKYNTTPEDKLKLDLFYIEHYTVWMDMKLLLLTFKILFQKENTEGIEQDQVTAVRGEQHKISSRRLQEEDF